MRRVNAKLVRAAGMRSQRDKREGIAGGINPAHLAVGRLAIVVDGHGLEPGTPALCQRIGDPQIGRGGAGDQRKIGFLHVAVGEGRGQAPRGGTPARQQQQAGRVLVDPVHKPHPVRIIPGKRLQHAVDMAGRAGPALHGKTAGFVNGDPVRILGNHHGVKFGTKTR